MTRAIIHIAASPEAERETRGLVLDDWKSGMTSVEAAMAIRDRARSAGEPVPAISIAQAYAANVIARHQDALYAARQQEAQRA